MWISKGRQTGWQTSLLCLATNMEQKQKRPLDLVDRETVSCQASIIHPSICPAGVVSCGMRGSNRFGSTSFSQLAEEQTRPDILSTKAQPLAVVLGVCAFLGLSAPDERSL